MRLTRAISLGVMGCAILVVSSESQVVTTAIPSSTAAGHSIAPGLSRDGRYVVFLSHANNLVPNDDLRPFLDVFVRDLQTSNTTLISVDRSGFGGGTGDSSHAAISENGRFIVFASQGTNLVVNDTNQTWDVFQRDLINNTTTLVSISTNGVAAGRSRRPATTPDGQWILFESAANDLVAGDPGDNDLFIRDTRSGVTRLVTERVLSPAQGSQFYSSTIDTNGHRVAFASNARNLYPSVANANGDVYVRDLSAETTFWASSNLTAYFRTEAYRCLNTVISGDGQQVVFKAVAFEATHLFVCQIDTGVTMAVATNSRPDTLAAFSADGRWLAFEERNAIYLRDLVNGTNLLVSVDSSGNGLADAVFLRPVITPDARHVAFIGSASNFFIPNVSHIYLRDISAGMTRVINLGTNGVGRSADVHAILPSIAADGRRVAFDTDAPDLVAGDNNRSVDIFVRDLDDALLRLVSVRHDESPTRTGFQSAGIVSTALSSNAQRIAFSSLDDPRVPVDTNRQHDVFVRDFGTASVFAISDPAKTLAPINEASIDPTLSANGESVIYLRATRPVFYVADFVELRWKPVAGGAVQNVDTNFTYTPTERHYAALSPDGGTVVYPRGDHLVWKNMITGSTGIVSHTGSRAPVGPSPSRSPVFSHNGRYVAFASRESYLVTNQTIYWQQMWQMYVRDLMSNTTRILSVETNDQPLLYAEVTSGVFSGNDRYVVYDGTFTADQWPRIYRFDMDTGANLLVCTNCRNPAISFDGQTIAYNSTWGRLANSNINVIDLGTGESEIITRDYAGNLYPTPQFAAPLLSADGRYVVVASKVATLVANDTNGFSDIFVRDRVQGTTILISRSRFGSRSAAGQSTRAVMAADGRTVAFQSFAGDLVEGDYNERRDIFVAKLGVGDSYNDGMEDDWEVAQFGNLYRDGAGDQDGDGQTDLQEYLAGTSPTNDASILRVLTVTPLGGGSTTVVWSAVVGRDYIVQFKDALDAEWTNASGMIGADSTSMSFAHNSSSSERFYRVITVQ